MALKKSSSEKDIELLLTFLADPNPATIALAKKQLRAIVRQNPDLRRLLENVPDPGIAREAREFLEETRLEALERQFRALARQGERLDLEEGACLLTSVAYPRTDRETIRRALDQIAEGIEEIFDAEEPTPSQEVALLRRYLFEDLGFHGNRQNYYDPDNSFINRVLERRVGIPISLSCVYLFVAWRLDMSAQGIGLPGHFIVSHALPPGIVYIDPFHDGRLLSRNDCMELVRQRGIEFHSRHLVPTPNNQILSRMIVNLMNLYAEQRSNDRAQWLGRLVPWFQDPA